jgi:hypothetical protein
MANKDEEFLGTARKRFAAAAEDEKHLREKFASDLKFASPDGDDQWDQQVKMQREAAGRPAMSFPRCHTFVQQVSNEARQNKPQIKFAPHGEGDKDTAEVYEGLARAIQYASDAQIAYETAIEYSAGASFGYYRFLTDYCDDDSDDLDLKVVPVLDPLQIYGILVPACFNRKPKYAFVIEDVPKEEYKLMYPDSELASLSWSEAEKQGKGWVGSDAVRIAEYWYVEETKEKGKRRPKTTVKFCKTNGFEILKDTETEWPGSSIPIIPVLGKQMIMEGKPRLFSVVRPQKAAQQLINYSKSRIAETLSIAPVSPFMVAVGQIPSGKQTQWENLNKSLTPYLEYEPVDAAGRPVPPPIRQVYEPPIQSLSAFVMQEIDDMKATTGIFDASLGNSANEVSGQAILRRKQQTDLTTMHFMDNLIRSFKKGGEVIAEMIPKIYDTEREIQTLGEDEAVNIVKINQQHQDENGKDRHYDMTKGNYKPIVTAGKAFDTKRSESFDTMQQLVQSAPNLLPMFGDVLFDSSDMAGASIVAKRFKKALPPNLQDDEDNEIPPQAQAAIQQGQQHIQALNAACQHYEQQIKQLEFEKAAKVVDNNAKFALHKLDVEADIAKAEITTKAQSAQEREAFVNDVALKVLDMSHQRGMAAQQASHAQDAQRQQIVGKSQLAGQQHDQSLELSDQGHQQALEAAREAAQNTPEAMNG